MIPKTSDDDEPGLSAILAGRRARLRSRLALYLLCAVVFAPLTGWLLALGWIAIIGGLAAGETLLRRGEGAKPLGVALVWLAGEGFAVGALGVAAGLVGGAWGAACGGMFLALTLFATAGLRRSSAPAFIAGAGPLAANMLLAAGLAGHASGRAGVAISMFGVALGVVAVSAIVWKTCAEALAGEIRARAEAERRLLEAEAAGRAAADFVALARRALTRPLQAVRSGADSLRRTAPALRAQAERFDAAGAGAQALLDDLRDLADLDAGRLRIDRSVFDLGAFMTELAEAWAPRLQARGLNLEMDGAATLPSAVLGDRERLRQVLDGLLGHALDVTDVGAVAISAHAVRLADDERRQDDEAWLVRIGVCDNGPGLRAGEAARLFTPFESRGEAPGRTGAAIGLSVGRGIARLMGGDLYAASAGGRGAAFTLEATFAAPTSDARPQRDAGAGIPAGLRVLAVDAHEADRRAAALILEPFGVRLTEASSYAGAFELLGAHAFDLVLLDLDGPEGFSREICRRLRAAAGPNRRTPLIGCSAATDSRDQSGLGLAGVVAKPFDQAVLCAVVSAALDPKSRAEAAA